MIGAQPAERGTPGQHLREAAEALLDRYPTAPAAETESAIAMFTLWALDAVEVGHLVPADADALFTLLDDEIDDERTGPVLSDSIAQLLFDGMTLHDWGTPFAPDVNQMRDLALSILRARS